MTVNMGKRTFKMVSCPCVVTDSLTYRGECPHNLVIWHSLHRAPELVRTSGHLTGSSQLRLVPITNFRQCHPSPSSSKTARVSMRQRFHYYYYYMIHYMIWFQSFSHITYEYLLGSWLNSHSDYLKQKETDVHRSLSLWEFSVATVTTQSPELFNQNHFQNSFKWMCLL